MDFFEEEEDEAHDHGDDRGQAHAFELDRSEDDSRAAEAGNHRDCRQDEVLRARVVDFLFDEHAQARSGDEAEEEDADAAHDRGRDGVDEGRNLADEGEEDSKDSSAADDPRAVDAGDGHDAHVFTIRRIRRRADEAGNDVGQAVGKERAVQARVLDQIAADDVAGDEEMAQVFGEDDEEGRHDHHDGAEIEFRLVEGRKGEPGHFLDVRPVDDAHEEGQDVACDDADEDRDDADEAPAEDAGQDGDDKGKGGNDHGRFIAHALDFAHIAGHVHGQRRQFQTDDGYDGAHSGRREEDINPFRADFVDDGRQDHEGEAEDDEAPLGVAVAHARRRADGEDRRNEGEARTEVGRQAPFADSQIKERADAVHEERRRRVDMEQERYEDRRAEHGE